MILYPSIPEKALNLWLWAKAKWVYIVIEVDLVSGTCIFFNVSKMPLYIVKNYRFASMFCFCRLSRWYCHKCLWFHTFSYEVCAILFGVIIIVFRYILKKTHEWENGISRFTEQWTKVLTKYLDLLSNGLRFISDILFHGIGFCRIVICSTLHTYFEFLLGYTMRWNQLGFLTNPTPTGEILMCALIIWLTWWTLFSKLLPFRLRQQSQHL